MSEPKPNACLYVVGTHDGRNVFCGKLPAPGALLCPKHVLIAADEMRALEHAAEKRRAVAAYRQGQCDALAESPLRAENPRFAPRVATYTEPEQ